MLLITREASSTPPQMKPGTQGCACQPSSLALCYAMGISAVLGQALFNPRHLSALSPRGQRVFQMIKIRENLLCDINVPDRPCNLQSHACLNSLMSLVLYKAASRRPWSRAIMAQDPPSSEMLNTCGKLLALTT